MPKPHIHKIVVSICFQTEDIEVGELVANGRQIYFKYYPDFIKTGIEISPIKLKLTDKICMADPHPFEGLFGVFADSLPDGWGRLLLDRSLLSQGISLSEVNQLDRLAYVGLDGMGALKFKPEYENNKAFELHSDLDKIALETHHILEGNATDSIEELYQLGGSSGGARPKILIQYNPANQQLKHGQQKLENGFEHWIIKFQSSADMKDMANIELAYSKMALDAGLEMSDCKLFKGNSGAVYFGTKRFDRINNNRLHLHSAAGMLNDNFRLSNMDYGHLMDAAFKLEKHVNAYAKVLRLAAFNVFSKNRDDHSKNMAFLMNHTGQWKLAPAYDLTFSTSAHGMHSTMVAGESKEPGKKDLMKLANHFKINNAPQIIQQVETVLSNWKNYAKDCGVTIVSLKRIEKEILNTLKLK